MNIRNLKFHRLFSKTLFRSLRLPLGEMTFTKDFITDTRGDLYPILEKSGDCAEKICCNRYILEGGSVRRMLCGFFPFAGYEVTFCLEDGSCGFSFSIPTGEAGITYDGRQLSFACGEHLEKVEYCGGGGTETMLVSCRPGFFDVYFQHNGQPILAHSFACAAFAASNHQSCIQNGYAGLMLRGHLAVHSACAFVDCGISQADLRPIRYENGDVMVENGKVYLTASARMQSEKHQIILSWVPGTSQFELTGALFYDAGDGLWCGDVAASVLYHRPTAQWYLWVCSFDHDHILGHAAFTGDPRFGVNVIDVVLMEHAPEGTPISTFSGFSGDEDPDFFYDDREQKWYMAICRLDPAIKAYRYVFFKSDHPFHGYHCIGMGYDGAETGGSFVRMGDQRIFACGNSFKQRANYRMYTAGGMHEAQFDFDDGGFRGWGTIIPVECGTRRRYFWLTFDRHNGSDYNWSYGNLYCFEAM